MGSPASPGTFLSHIRGLLLSRSYPCPFEIGQFVREPPRHCTLPEKQYVQPFPPAASARHIADEQQARVFASFTHTQLEALRHMLRQVRVSLAT